MTLSAAINTFRLFGGSFGLQIRHVACHQLPPANPAHLDSLQRTRYFLEGRCRTALRDSRDVPTSCIELAAKFDQALTALPAHLQDTA